MNALTGLDMGADLIMEWFAVPPGRDEEVCYTNAQGVIEEMKKFHEENPWREGEEGEGDIIDDNIQKFAQEFYIWEVHWTGIHSADDLYFEEYIGSIEGSLSTLKNLTKTWWRFMTSNSIGGWEIYVAGTASWGDSPPEPWPEICTLKYAAGKVWDALGYTWPSDCVPPKEEERGLANKTSFQLHLGF